MLWTVIQGEVIYHCSLDDFIPTKDDIVLVDEADVFLYANPEKLFEIAD